MIGQGLAGRLLHQWPALPREHFYVDVTWLPNLHLEQPRSSESDRDFAMMQGEQAEQPKRLAVTLPHLGVGGAQRVAAMLANWWADQGLEVDLITLMNCPEDFYELRPKVKRYFLSKEEGS